jgi:hypothetical protein
MPDEVRIAIEQVLKADGFYAGEAKGYFGPAVRKGPSPRGWMPMGQLPRDSRGAKLAGRSRSQVVVPTMASFRLRERAFVTIKETKDVKSRDGAIELVNLLARNGDVVSRWELVRAYDDVPLLQKFVTPEEMTRYSLDLMVSRPKVAEKIDFEFIFNLSALFTMRQGALFGAALIDAVRDDPRLQDPLTLGGISTRSSLRRAAATPSPRRRRIRRFRTSATTAAARQRAPR